MSIFTSPGKLSELATAPAARPSVGLYARGWILYFFEYVPGLVLLALLAALGRVLGRGEASSYSLLIAILLGILIRNVVGLNSVFECGTRTYEVFWKAGIVLLGSQMGLQSFREFGLKGVGLAGTEVIVVIALTLLLGRILKIPATLCCLLAAGMGICGVSAVIALAGVLHSDEEDTGYVVSLILLFGLAVLSSMPVLGRLLNLDDFHLGVWAGLSVNNTAEAVATGFIYSEAAGHYATIAKLARNLFLGGALLYFVYRTLGEQPGARTSLKLKALAWGFPKFGIGLLLFSGLATVHFWSSRALADLNHLYRWAFLLGFAGVGLRTDLSRLRRRGLKPLALAVGIQSLTLLFTLVGVLLAF